MLEPITAQTPTDSSPLPASAVTHEFLSFRVGKQHYGVDLLRVQEIRSFQEPTRIASTSASVRGLLNLRGVIVPVIDLRTMLGTSEASIDASTVTIIVHVGTCVIGAVVDAVSDVVSVLPAQMRPLPNLEGVANSELLTGLAALDERLLLLLNLEALVNELGEQHNAAAPVH